MGNLEGHEVSGSLLSDGVLMTAVSGKVPYELFGCGYTELCNPSE